jgi:diguanylate cyclase (GGDEF)-like protein
MTSGRGKLMAETRGERPRILVVDDDPLMRRIIAQSLDKANYELFEAESGPSGLEAALKERPDLIILDVIMPGMDGFDVVIHLRRHPITQSIPIILLTALGEITEKIHGMQLGADDYITKPFDPRELRARVQAHLKRSEQYLQTSPLTNLPGNPAIQQVITARIAAREPMAVIYLDLSNFKAYNDKYGWLAGDRILKELGELIVQTVLERGDKDDFVGHIGGDDFVILTRPTLAEDMAKTIIHDFDERIPQHYNAEDRERGYIEGTDRQGTVRQFPLTCITAGIVTNEYRELFHPLQVAQLAAEVKHYLKMLPGSQYGFDRRRK